MTTQSSSRSPTLPEVLRAAIEQALEDVHVALPGRIETWDPATQKASVKPLVKRLVALDNGEELLEELPVIPDVPVVFPRSASYFLSMPLAAGDFVMLVFAERSIDTWLSADGSDSDPADFRRHDLTDAVAIPGLVPFSKALAEVSADKAVLGKDRGLQVRVGEDLIELGTTTGLLDFVALAQKVLTELQAVQADQVALKALLVAHVHAGVTVGGGVTGTSPAFAAYTPHTPATVAAAKTKAE